MWNWKDRVRSERCISQLRLIHCYRNERSSNFEFDETFRTLQHVSITFVMNLKLLSVCSFLFYTKVAKVFKSKYNNWFTFLLLTKQINKSHFSKYAIETTSREVAILLSLVVACRAISFWRMWREICSRRWSSIQISIASISILWISRTAISSEKG